MKKTVIGLALFFSFLASGAFAQTQAPPTQNPPEIEKFDQAVTQLIAQTPHSPAFGAALAFDHRANKFVLLGHYFSKNNEMIAQEIGSISVNAIDLANYQEKAESFAPKIRAFFQDRQTAQQHDELKTLDSFITLTQTENNFWGLFDGFIHDQQTMTQELAQINDKFIEVRIFPGLSNRQRVFHFYVGVDESQGTIRQLHYYPVDQFLISYITTIREPARELADDMTHAFTAAANKLRQLR